MRVRALAAAVVLSLTLAARPAPAQVTSGEIAGRVTDDAGSAVPRASVTVSGPPLLRSMSMRTTPSGAYRFPDLPVGVYRAEFGCDGFATTTVTAIVVDAGAAARVDVRLRRASAGERLAPAPSAVLLDAVTTTVGARVTREDVDLLPNRRDPWYTIGGLAGVAVAGGGTALEVSAAALLSARGTDASAVSLDGARIFQAPLWPDLAPAPLDRDAIEQVRVQTGGADASVQGGAVDVSVVSRSASSRSRGSARLLAERAGPAASPEHAIETGLEAGTPLGSGRAWAWGALSRAGTASSATTTAGAKLQVQWSGSQASTLDWSLTRRVRPVVRLVPGLDFAASNRQADLGWARPIQLQHRWIASDRLSLEARGAYSDASFTLEYQDAALARVQPLFDRTTGDTRRSTSRQENRRSTSQVTVVANAFVSGPLGGDHSLRAGVDGLGRPWEQVDQTGGGAVAGVESATGLERSYRAWIYRDGRFSIGQSRWSAWVQDSFRRGQLTINLGLRYDRQDDRARPVTLPANPVLPDLLPVVRFQSADSGVTFHDLAPRFGAAWDVSGHGRTVMRASLARYWGDGVFTAERLQPTGQSWLAFPWNDSNGDLLVQRDELDLASALGRSSNYVADSPATVATLTRVDPALRNDVANEATAGFEREVTPRFALGVTWVFRRYEQFQGTYRIDPDGSPVPSSSYDPVVWAPPPTSCPAGSFCPAVTYYQRAEPLPPTGILRNDGRYRWHHSVDVTARRRLANGWSVALALTWQWSRTRFPAPTRDYTDPTNIAQQDGRDYGTQNARWLGRFSGTRTLPGGLRASAVFTFRQGYPFVQTVRSPERGALGSTDVMAGPYASERYPDLYLLDVGLERAFTVRRVAILPTVNVFNAANAATVLARQAVQNSPSANQVTAVTDPRGFRVELRVRW